METPSYPVESNEKKWDKLAERYTRSWLEVRSGIPKPHSWAHTIMAAKKSTEVAKMLGATDEELDATYLAGLGHDAIQPALIKGDELISQMQNEWDFDPTSSEDIESAKATRYVISSESWQQRNPISQAMINRVTESIAGNGIRVGPGGELEKTDDPREFKDWDLIAKSLYVADKAVNQEPTMIFALCNFTPYKGSNERPFTHLDRDAPDGVATFLRTWFKKREHLLENTDLAELLEKTDPEISKKIEYLRQIIDEYDGEVEAIRTNPESRDFYEKYGIMGAVKLSQEFGSDEVNENEFEIAKRFIEQIQGVDESSLDPGMKAAFEFSKQFANKLQEVLEKYAE